MKTFIFKKHNVAKKFNCSHCVKKKKSKNIATNADDSTDEICNGCYGQLLSKHLIIKG